MTIEPIPHEFTRWIVFSETRAETAYIVDSNYYTARRDGCLWACGCERFMADDEICKHIRTVRKRYPHGRHFAGDQLPAETVAKLSSLLGGR